MPFDGFGNFLRLYSWVVDATNSVKIRADRHDDEDNNFTAGLSNCITKDGQTSVTQNIPLNSRRLVSVADPVDPQDAATKHYADTKMPLDGSAPMTGNVTITNPDATLTLNGQPGHAVGIVGAKNGKNRWELFLGDSAAETGSNAGSNLDLYAYADDGSFLSNALTGIRSTGLLSVKGDPTAALGIATKQYTDVIATAAAANKLPLTGGTISGNLQVNGNLGAGQNSMYFGAIGSAGWIQWNGGGNYTLGGGGTIYHSGNFTIAPYYYAAKLLMAADMSVNFTTGVGEPLPAGIMTGFGYIGGAAFARFRYLQLKTTGGWYTVGVTDIP